MLTTCFNEYFFDTMHVFGWCIITTTSQGPGYYYDNFAAENHDRGYIHDLPKVFPLSLSFLNNFHLPTGTQRIETPCSHFILLYILFSSLSDNTYHLKYLFVFSDPVFYLSLFERIIK
jgi:hypothetical protein